MLVKDLLESLNLDPNIEKTDWIKNKYGQYEMTATVGDTSVKLITLLQTYANHDCLHIWFETMDPQRATFNIFQTNTHSTPPMKIFSVVANSFTHIIKQMNPDAVAFYVLGDELTRQSLYMRIAKRFNTAYPNTHTNTNPYGDIVTVLYKDNIKPNEQEFLTQLIANLD